MSETSGLRSGINVRIRRTDGREHTAVVSTINYSSRSVLVEWPEQGEIRGKEIDFDTLFSLNSTLAPQTASTVETMESSKIVRNTSRMSIPRSIVKAQDHTGISTNGTTERGNLTTRGVENIPPLQHQISYNNRNNNVVDVGSRSVPSRTSVSTDRKPRRTTNVVKAVEKLQQNREDRRQRQAEKKEEREALMNVEPGHPKWQFLNMIREYRQSVDFRPLRAPEPVDSHQITVCVRKRPLNKSEILKKELDVVSIPRKDAIVVHEPKHKVDLTKYLENQQFRFDYAFDENCSNELVYHYTAKPLVQTVFEGGMATCFAYGQTGSGKTHTMGGTFVGKHQDCNKGIYALVAKDVFLYLNSAPYKNQRLIVASSFFEIYSGKVFDLLSDKAKLRVLEDGKQQVQIVGLTERVVSSVDQVLALIAAGNAARTSGQTSANANSSRSHAVFQFTLRTAAHRIHGKFSLIDLAGNERGADTMSADRLTRMEGAEINKSLLALKECIRALGRKGAHLPFRVSKLTQVLRDSFIGDNSRTCMIAMISPGMGSCEHSLNTLRYADRVKELDPAADTGPSGDAPLSDEPEPMEDDAIGALRSLNEGELSADLCNFHEALSHLQQLEDDVLDTLKAWTEGQADEARLIDLTRNVDYDQEDFASRLDQVLSERARQLNNLREKVKAFRQQLAAEEEISKRITAQKPQQKR